MSTTTAAEWRYAKKNKPCPVCGKPDWCRIRADGFQVLCMRVHSPIDTPSGGWLHVLVDDDGNKTERTRARPLPVRVLARDFGPLAEQWQRDLGPVRLAAFADSLGVTPASLRAFGCGWNGRGCYSWPMHDADGRVVGVRLRDERTGDKFAVRGGHEGVFLPTRLLPGLTLLPEGPTSCAAASVFGFAAIGRPSCRGATRIIATLTRGFDVVVMRDPDPAGRDGAEALASALLPTVRTLRVVELPAGTKDLRDALRQGMKRAELLSLVEAQPCRQLRLREVHR